MGFEGRAYTGVQHKGFRAWQGVLFKSKRIKTTMKAYIPTLEGDEAEEFIRKADENVRLMKQRRCKNHVWRKHYLNGGKVCQVCGKAKETPTRNKDVEE
jgi:hypothetical protein